MNTYAMFAIPLGVVEIANDICEALKPLSDKYGIQSGTPVTTSDFVILNKNKEIKQELTSIFSKWANDIEGQELSWVMTSSWITHNPNGDAMTRHNHRNCTYSGVLYFDEVDIPAHPSLIFENPIDTTFNKSYFGDDKAENIFNNPRYAAPMQKGLMIFFPSYVYHFHRAFKSNLNRKSLACNFAPTGFMGCYDSIIDTNWLKHGTT